MENWYGMFQTSNSVKYIDSPRASFSSLMAFLAIYIVVAVLHFMKLIYECNITFHPTQLANVIGTAIEISFCVVFISEITLYSK